MASPNISMVSVGLILIGLTTWQFFVASDLRKENENLTHKLNDTMTSRLNASKLSCADRAQRYFTSLGYNEAESKDNTGTTFQNHFSSRLDRCLMTIESSSFTEGHQVNSTTLIDVDERKDFGDYAWVSSDTEKYYEHKPIQCTISPPDREEKRCHSTEEWNAYIKEILSS